MPFLVKRSVHKNKRKSCNAVMVLVPIFIAGLQLIFQLLLLLPGAFQGKYLVTGIWKNPEYFMGFFFFKPGQKRKGWKPPPDTIAFPKLCIQREYHMNIIQLYCLPDQECKEPRRIYQANIYFFHISLHSSSVS